MPLESILAPLTFVICLMLMAIVVALFSIAKAVKSLTDVIEKQHQK